MAGAANLDRVFAYKAMDANGRWITDQITAADARAALKALTGKGLTPTTLTERPASRAAAKAGEIGFTDRVTVLRQMALMVEAGVGLLEAIDTVTMGITASQTRQHFEQLAKALKRGETFAQALESQAPGFPFYVYAMIRVGEATGQLDTVLRDAAEQMAYEDRLRREFANALTYPAFLASAGLAAVLFIFTAVVPRFAVMVGDKRDKMPWISRMVIETGEFASSHIWLVLAGLVGLGLAVAAMVGSPALRLRAYNAAHGLPLIGDLLRYREITTWSRLTGFALRNGVGLLEASDLARQATPQGRFRRGLEQFERDIKAGVTVDQSLGRHTQLTPMDLSLLRVGQKSGALGKMFDFLADGYDAKLTDSLKRLTALIEPLAIGLVSVLVGIVALSLVLALSSVYDSVL